MKRIFFIPFLLLILEGVSLGQIPDEVMNERKRDSERLKTLENQRSPLPKIDRFYRKKLTKEQKERLTPSKKDLVKYKEFLKIPNFWITKILPFPNCDPFTVNADDLKCIEALPIFGNGSFYSFYEKSHTDFSKLNIVFAKDKFYVNLGFNSLGIISKLEKSDLNSVTLDTKEIRTLGNFTPTKKYSELFQQKRRFQQGFTVDGKTYKTEVPVELNNIYGLRTVNYYKVGHLGQYYNNYSDMTLVFQIVDKDSEGAVTLIWKELDKKSGVEVSR